MEKTLKLIRYTQFPINKKEIKDYLYNCENLGKTPDSEDFLSFIGYSNDWSYEEIIDTTEIEDDDDFYNIIQ